ncbi:uncharacterized protein LOC115261430 isoform X1 [Aedes albopictus]|uniref:Secreted protein n=1 Tax=Aedes albopictus TaxID=7160 RepID=A0ABM1YEB6_AEDAL
MKMARLPKNAAFAVVCLLHLLILSGQWQSTSAISSSSVSSSVTGAVAGGNSSENVLQTAETSSPGTTGGPVGTKRTCSNVHSIFEQRGFNTANMPTDPVTGSSAFPYLLPELLVQLTFGFFFFKYPCFSFMNAPCCARQHQSPTEAQRATASKGRRSSSRKA